MADELEPHRSSPHGEPEHGGHAEGAFGEQQRRPGMGEKVKHTLANVKDKIVGHKGQHASNFPASSYYDDPQLLVGHPSAAYGHTGHGLGNGGENAHHRRPLSPSPRSPRSPRSPHVAVGHNPEFEPIGVGEQAADTVMPGHHVDHHHSDPNSPHHQSKAEKFVEKLPGYGQNPYKHYDHVPVVPSPDGHEHHHSPSPLRDPVRQHVVGESENLQHVGEGRVQPSEKRSGFVSKLRDLVTGQKPGHGAGTGSATTDQTAEMKDEHQIDRKSGNRADLHGGTQPYIEEPTPVADGDLLGNVKQKIRGQDVQPQQTWPSPTKPDYRNMPGAVRTDDQGKPIEGPKEEGKSPKSEGVMSKIMEKLHIGQQKPAGKHTPTSPGATPSPRDSTPHTPTAGDSTPHTPNASDSSPPT